MADDIEHTEFTLECNVRFDSSDVVQDLTPVQTIDLIAELEDELDSWEAAILLSRLFSDRAKLAPAELLVMTDEQLEERLAVASETESK